MAFGRRDVDFIKMLSDFESLQTSQQQPTPPTRDLDSYGNTIFKLCNYKSEVLKKSCGLSTVSEEEAPPSYEKPTQLGLFEYKEATQFGSLEYNEATTIGSTESKGDTWLESFQFQDTKILESFESKEVTALGSFQCKDVTELGSFECKSESTKCNPSSVELKTKDSKSLPKKPFEFVSDLMSPSSDGDTQNGDDQSDDDPDDNETDDTTALLPS